MRVTRYRLTTRHEGVSFKAVIVADLHDFPYAHMLPVIADIQPDVILVPGDLTEYITDKSHPNTHRRPGLGFLAEAVRIAPTFYSLGNHEIGAYHESIRRSHIDLSKSGGISGAWREVIEASGATLLDDGFVTWQNITIGGLGSGLLGEMRIPRHEWIEQMTAQKGYKILLCHHPEYDQKFLQEYDLDMVVSGHAHGGQWRIFGRGVYAPDQGVFPRYTAGVYHDRLVVSRGVVNTVRPIPRICNPCELVVVEVKGQDPS